MSAGAEAYVERAAAARFAERVRAAVARCEVEGA